MVISEKSLEKGVEVDMSSGSHKTLPNRAIRFNKEARTNKFELYNYMTGEVDYTFRDLDDLIKTTNRLFKRDDSVVNNISYHSDSMKKGGALSKEFKFNTNFIVYVPST